MDRREAILVRLLEIAAAIEGINRAERNRPDISESSLPALVLHDGDEVAEERPSSGSGRQAPIPVRVVMTPPLILFVASGSATVGSEINAFRLKIIKAVLNDGAIQVLVGANGQIRYEGCAPLGLERGRAVEGSLVLNFSFRYPLVPSEL